MESEDSVLYFFDGRDEQWVQGSASAIIAPSQVKDLYGFNANTNAYTDDDKDKVQNVNIISTGVISVTLDENSWVGAEAPFFQSVVATGIKAGEVATVDIDLSGVADYEDDTAIVSAWGNVYRSVATDADEVTVHMNSIPEVDIPVSIKYVRDEG